MGSTASSPLTPAVLHILLALSTEARHGYGIMKQVERESHGKVKMGPGTLYGSIGRMIEAGLIRESDKRPDPALDDERRIYYAITAVGHKALEAELKRYREVVAVATEKRLAPRASADGG
jgi:DNA-binding PadR family transcriptional regulator